MLGKPKASKMKQVPKTARKERQRNATGLPAAATKLKSLVAGTGQQLVAIEFGARPARSGPSPEQSGPTPAQYLAKFGLDGGFGQVGPGLAKSGWV